MPDATDFLDALFAGTVHRGAIFDDQSVVELPLNEDEATQFETVSTVTPDGVAFVFGVMDDVEDDAWKQCRIAPSAALYNDGRMIVCWTLADLHHPEEVADLTEALGMVSPDEPVPLPGVRGWRLMHTDARAGATLTELMRVYGSPQEPAPTEEAAPWDDDTYLDAKVITPYDESDPRYDFDITVSFGKDRFSKQWKPAKMPLGQFIAGLCRHKEGQKDGLAFVMGDMVPGQRTKTAIKTLEGVGLDIDTGISTAKVDAALKKFGKLAIRYSTHSHLKTESEFSRDRILKWAAKKELDEEIDTDLIREFLTDQEDWDAAIVESAEYLRDDHTAGGIKAIVGHLAMPKHRIVTLFREPFDIAAQGGTQADAMKRWGEVPRGLAALLGVPLDESCLDPSRLFYMPRHGKGKPFEISLFGGDLFDWNSLVLDSPWDNVAAKLEKGSGKGGKSKTAKGKELGSWSVKAAHGFLICQAIEDFCPDRIRHDVSAGLEIECPFDEEHSNPGDLEDRACLATSAGDGPSPLFVIKCQHESCKDYTNLDMLGKMIEDEWFETDILKDPSYNVAEIADAPDPKAAERVDRKDKAQDAYGAAVEALSEHSSTKEVSAVLRLMLEGGLGILEFGKNQSIIATNTKKSITDIRKLTKTTQAELKAEGNVADPMGRKMFRYSGEYHFDEAFNTCFQVLKQKNAKDEEPAFCCVQESLVRLNRSQDGRVSFDEISAQALWAELNNMVTFVRELDGGLEGVRAQVPEAVSKQVYEQAYKVLPQAPEVVSTPVFIQRKKGVEVITEPKWYAADDILMAKTGFKIPKVKEHPTYDDVEEAISLLTDYLLFDFPFLDYDQNGVERREPAYANCMAMLITPFMRRLINSPTPVFFVSKPISGTGGTLLGKIPMILFDGEEPTPEPYTQNEEEMRKSLLASIMTARSHLFFDDVREFNNRVLLQSITSHSIGGRLLGATRTIERPNRFNWVGTGNNPIIGSEMERRLVNIRLNAKVEDIQSRKYKIPNLPEWMKQERPFLVHAILTIIQNWVDSGMPKFHDRKRASFEDWSMKVGGILMCAGIEGFLDNGRSPTADMEEAAIKLFVRDWRTRFADNPMSMAELFQFAMENEHDIADGNNDDMKKHRFAARLPRLNGRVFKIDKYDYIVKAALDENGITVYRMCKEDVPAH